MPSRAKPVRQSVTNVVSLAGRGVRAERELKATYHRFMKEQDPARKEETGKDLVRAIFGKDAIAEDTLL